MTSATAPSSSFISSRFITRGLVGASTFYTPPYLVSFLVQAEELTGALDGERLLFALSEGDRRWQAEHAAQRVD
jgi:hypothetical protein